MSRSSSRTYVAECQYEGLAPFWVGTALARICAPQHEIEAAVFEMIDEVLPTRPKLLRIVPGVIVMHLDEEREAA